ncbi:DinB family protein [Deinococcus sp.]|uniref:DinB family protein n=1 Tax=Deinococcus sp. TaxID=47478 RepID=UPI002869A494|nr:DinB family protein [Deinococcus sp.]
MTAADPVTRAELIAALNATRDDVSTYFGALDPQAFTAGSDERWSPAHHLDHLTRATTPVAAGLGISLHLLAPREPGVASRSYAEVRAAYLAALAGGQKAFGRYLPSPDGDQTAIVARYTDAMNTLLENLAHWFDADLDACSMPHPVLGTISVREMLHFTHYHNHHHLCGVQTGVGPAARGSP